MIPLGENEYGLSSLEQLIADNDKSYEGWNCNDYP